MVSDEALNTLLDQLAALDRREDRLAILRTWIVGLMRARVAEHTDEQLAQAGFAPLLNLDGGMEAWQTAGTGMVPPLRMAEFHVNRPRRLTGRTVDDPQEVRARF